MYDKYLVFDIWSCYGHFKKPYTTTSPLTYSIPTRTAVTGMLSAIAGLEKNTCNRYFSKDKAKIAVSIRKPIKKVRLAENLINTKKSVIRILEHTQIKFEFLKDPHYRIYFTHNDTQLYEILKTNLINHSPVYTVCMGLSENLADFSFIGEFEGSTICVQNDELVEIDSIIPLSSLKQASGSIDFEYNSVGEYFTETIPLEMDEHRNITEFGEVIFERNCQKIRGLPLEFIFLKELNEKIVLL
ncbi:MAG: type I-B CRISPR-associated protein Cas5b [Acetivibrionales bacterium]|jgi:CRISPR-associated protein Cas5h